MSARGPLLQCLASRKKRQVIFYYERTNLMRLYNLTLEKHKNGVK